MKKKICTIVLSAVAAFACVFGLAACGSENDNNSNAAQGGNQEELDTYEPTEGLKYIVNGSYYGAAGVGTSTDTEIFIAKTYNGKPVIAIAPSAFSYKGITSVTMPSSIKSIGEWAFSYSGLTSVTIPDSVTSIGFGAFDYCDSLTSVTIGKGVTSVGANTFLNCSSLNRVTINAKLKSIVDGMFQGCSSLTDIAVPNGVTRIGILAFSGCGSLTSITIPKSVTRIERSAFSECDPLTVYYEGSEQEWNAIDIGDGNDGFTNATYHFHSNGNGNSENNEENNGDNSGENNGNTESGSVAHTLTYDLNYDGASNLAQQVEKGETVNLITPQRSGYRFLGWYYNWWNKIESGVWQYDSDITLTAKWEAIKYSVTYNTDSGTIPENALKSFTVSSYSLPYTLPIPQKEGHNFAGWYETADFSGEPINAIPKNSLKNYVLYAKYTDEELLEYELSFDDTYYSVVGYKGSPQYVAVPETYENLPVKEIAVKAFENCNTLIGITLPDSVCKIGGRAFYGCGNLTSIVIPEGVTSIGDYAFYGCSSLTSIVIPEGVTSIGNYAFYGCSSLTSVVIAEGVTSIGEGAFYYCRSLTSITIPEGVTSIGEGAFYNCSSLTSITIPEGVTSINRAAFYNCSSLTSITIPEGVTSIGSSAFLGCSSLTSIAIPDGATYIIDGSAFPYHLYKRYSGCYYLPTENSDYGFLFDVISNDIDNIKVHSDCKTINSGAFEDCRSLTSIAIPDSVTTIGSGAFKYCSSLENIFYLGNMESWCAISGLYSLMSVGKTDRKLFIDGVEITGELTLPDGVTSIGSGAFYCCRGLTSITLPDGVTKIGERAFSGCSSLISITLPDGVTSIGNYAFYGCSSLTSVVIAEGATSIVLSEGVTGIGEYAFNGCISLTSITIPNGVTYIGDYAFKDCSKLTSIIIPDSVTHIANYVFENCRSLTSITIPNSVTSISSEAFCDCSSLKTVFYKGTADDWSNIEIDEFENYYITRAKRYYYSATEPTKNGNYWHYDEDEKTPVVW